MTTPNTNPSDLDREALKPCPFCGGEAEVVEGDECAYVQCMDMKMHRAIWFSGDNTAAEQVAEQWNKRALPRASGVPEAEAVAWRWPTPSGIGFCYSTLLPSWLNRNFDVEPLYASPPPVAAPSGELALLSKANSIRGKEWDPQGILDSLFFAVELAGEIGEACNVVKKLERESLGIRGSRDTVEHLADELADGIICIDKIASQYGIELWPAVVAKFNATSDKMGLTTKLPPPSPIASEPKDAGSGEGQELTEDEQFAALVETHGEGYSFTTSVLAALHAAGFSIIRIAPSGAKP